MLLKIKILIVFAVCFRQFVLSQEGMSDESGKENLEDESEAAYWENWEKRNNFAQEHNLPWASEDSHSYGQPKTPPLPPAQGASDMSEEEVCYRAILEKLEDCAVGPANMYEIEECDELGQEEMKIWGTRPENAQKAGTLMRKIQDCHVANETSPYKIMPMQMDLMSKMKAARKMPHHTGSSCKSILGYSEQCDAKCDKSNFEQYESNTSNDNPSVCGYKCDHQMECIGFYWNPDGGTCKYFRGNGTLLAGEALTTAICYSKDEDHKKRIEEKHNKVKHKAEVEQRKQDSEKAHKKEREEEQKQEKLQRLTEKKDEEDVERGEQIHAIKQVKHQLDSVSETVQDRLSVAIQKLDKMESDIEAKRTNGVPNAKSKAHRHSSSKRKKSHREDQANTLLSF